MPEVTVIIPLYNKGKYIARALRSVFAQTFQDFVVLVVDDGSTDHGPEVVGQVIDKRLHLIRQHNAGPGAARNRGLRESATPLVAFLDADDEFLPEFLERSLANLRAHPGCVLSVCGTLRGEAREPWSPPEGFSVAQGAWRMPATLDPRKVSWAILSMHTAVVCRRQPILELGGFYENRCAFGEDIYLWLLVFLNYPVFNEPTALMWYHTESSDLNWYHIHGNRMHSAEAIRKRPLLPWLTDPARLRQNCPPDYLSLLELHLAYNALSEALTRASIGDLGTAEQLRVRFRLMRSFRWEFTKLLAKLAMPTLLQIISRLKLRLRRRLSHG